MQLNKQMLQKIVVLVKNAKEYNEMLDEIENLGHKRDFVRELRYLLYLEKGFVYCWFMDTPYNFRMCSLPEMYIDFASNTNGPVISFKAFKEMTEEDFELWFKLQV
jgi:hypothetical protein